MKTLRLLLFSVLSVSLWFTTGCGTVGQKPAPLQRVLDATLPATFTGAAHVYHKNTWIDIEVQAGGLRRDAAGWTYDWLRYRRNGRFSHGWVTLGTPPAGAAALNAQPSTLN